MHSTDEVQVLKIDVSLRLFNTVNISRKVINDSGFYVQQQGCVDASQKLKWKYELVSNMVILDCGVLVVLLSVKVFEGFSLMPFLKTNLQTLFSVWKEVVGSPCKQETKIYLWT